jgi:hypothetical protein
MPARPGQDRRLSDDRDRQPVGTAADEAGKSDRRDAEITTQPANPHAGYDANLNPIDDELINTRGSER